MPQLARQRKKKTITVTLSLEDNIKDLTSNRGNQTRTRRSAIKDIFGKRVINASRNS